MFSKKFLLSLCSAIILFFASIGLAEVQMYDGVGKYVMSDFENQDIAKQRARVRAEQAAKDFSRVENYKLAANEISAITNNITNVVGEVKYESSVAEVDGMPVVIWTATLQANIDTDGIKNYLDLDEKGKITIVQQNESLQKDRAENDKKVEDLKKRAAKATDAEKSELEKEFAQADKEFLAQQKLGEGNQLYYQKDYQGAISKFNDAIKINPNYFEAYNNLGAVYLGLQNYSQAIEDLNQAITLNPNFAEAYNNLGLAYYRLKNYTQAIENYTKSIDLNNPELHFPYNNRGLAYAKLKNYEQAFSDYNQAIKINSDYFEAYNNRGAAYYDLKNYSQAISDWTQAIQLNPNYAEAYNNRGVAYRKLQKYEQAIKDFTKSIELNNPELKFPYSNRAKCYQALGKTAEAEKDFARARELGYKG